MENKGRFRRHKILIGIGILFVLVFMGSLLPEDSNSINEDFGNSQENYDNNLVEETFEQEKEAEGSVITDSAVNEQEEIEDNGLVEVVFVVDGDTVWIEGDEKVRLICIDTPEKEDEGFQEATNYLEDLLLNKEVRLEKDVSERDRYNRLLRYVYLEDGTFVNELIVRKGYGKAYPYSPDTSKCPEIQEAEEKAKEEKLGIWADEPRDSKDDSLSDYDCSSNKYNCPDFKTRSEAQRVFEMCGGRDNDVHHLDKDKDGLACESLP